MEKIRGKKLPEKKEEIIEPENKGNILSDNDDTFSIIKSSENEEKEIPADNNLPIIFQEQKTESIIPALAKPIALPEFNTIEEMENKGVAVPKDIQKEIEFLQTKTTEIDFKKLSILQLTAIRRHIKKIEAMSNLELFNMIRPYM